MSLPQELLRKDRGLGDWAILTAYRGSIAHGMYVPKTDPNSIDDKDVISICVPSASYYVGMKNYGSRGTKEIKFNEWDVVIYEVKKALSLLAQGNPNILSLLWLSPQHYITITDAGKHLLWNRQVFVGKHVYRPFIGYARSQLHKMTHQAFQGYMGEKRKELVNKFGYDTKNAAHLIRILRMGIEFLNEGRMYVERKDDAQELIGIKRGEWSLEKVQERAEQLFTVAQLAYVKSTLPSEPDPEEINNLCGQIVKIAWKERYVR